MSTPQTTLLSPSAETLSPLSRRALHIALVVAYVGFGVLIGLIIRISNSDLTKFFWPAAEIAAHGHPLLIYSVRAGAYPNANGPLSVVPLTLVALLTNALGVGRQVTLYSALTVGAFSLFTLLMAREAVRVIEITAGRSARPLLRYAAFLLSLPVLIALACYGHVEEPLELWLTLLGLRLLLSRRLLLAGLVMGLVLLTRTAAMVALFAFVLMVLADPGVPQFKRRALRAATLLLVAGAVALLGMLPFLLADRHDVIYSLVTYRGALPIAGGSFWVLLARGLPWASIVQHQDTILFSVAALAVVGWALRHTRTALTPARACALLAIAALCVPLLAKTTWSYYMCDPYVFATIWWLARPAGRPAGRRVWVPFLLSLLSLLLATRGLQVPPPPIQVMEGLISGAVVLGCLWILLRSWQGATRTGGGTEPARVQ
jgi:hypothetical protein